MAGSAYSIARSQISDAVAAAARKLGYGTDGIEGSIAMSSGFGDISCSLPFRISKAAKRDPQSVAGSIREKLPEIEIVEKVTVENGFINFHLDRQRFSELAIMDADAISQGAISDIGKGRKAIIEYTSANPIHPLHVGQLRNALLGDSLSRIYSSSGFKVEREDYIDDLGLQMMQALWGFQNSKREPGRKFDHMLGEIYVSVNKRIESSDAEKQSIKEQVDRLSGLVEQNGTYESNLSREVAEQCVKAQYETLFNYGIYHDVMVWESDILRERLLEKGMEMLSRAGLAHRAEKGEYKDCIVIDLDKIKDLPKEFKGLKETIKVLVRSNGTPTYVAKDIAFHMWKLGMLENRFKYAEMGRQPDGTPLYSTASEGKRMDFGNVDIAVNIIDSRQSYPQEVLKLAFTGMGKPDMAGRIVHLAYGMVNLEDAKLAGRKGTWMGNTADDMLEEAVKKAKTLMGSKLELSSDEQERVSRSVALSAIKFEFLKVAPDKNITFSWEWALNFDGNSGPYAQYMHARATRILDSAHKLPDREINAGTVSDSEFMLVKRLSVAREMAEKAANELRPNVITEYINSLAYAFSSFYESSPILKAETEDKSYFRLRLASAFRSTMRTMLGLLGIEALERM